MNYPENSATCSVCGRPVSSDRLCCSVQILSQQLAASEAARVKAERRYEEVIAEMARRDTEGARSLAIAGKCVQELTGERDAWKNTAAELGNNGAYYRGLVVRCGEVFGKAARTQDDGGIVEDVLCAKVPELVVSLKRERDALAAALVTYGNHKMLSCPLAGTWAEISSAVWKGSPPTCNCGFDDALRGSQAILREHNAALVKPLVAVKEAVESWADCRQTAEGALNLIHSVVDEALAAYRKEQGAA